jgi:hypothetical protein
MISKINDVYLKVSKKQGIPYDLVKSVGDAVFLRQKEAMVNFEHSSMQLCNFGTFVLKSVKVENQCRRYLSMRKYLVSKYPDYINKPIGKKTRELLRVYLTQVIPFKKAKQQKSLEQVEYCKKKYEENNNKPTE